MPRRPLTGLRLGRRRWLAWLLLLAGIIAFRPAVPAAAQAPVPSYWRYEAFGRLDLLEVADVNHDGMDEFVLVSEERDVALVSSAGEERWVYRADTPVLFLATANVHGAAEPRREIVLATASALLLLDSEGDLLWEAPLPLTPIDVAAFATGVEGREEILIAGAQSELILYDAQGRARWSYFASADAAGDVPPSLLVADVDHDGQSEAALGYYVTRGFSQLVLVNSRGQEIWKRSLSGRITAMAPVGFAEDGPLSIAVGTFLQANRTFVILYETAGGRELFYRTPNKQVTSLAQAQLPEGRALLVGTAVGTVIAYDQSGRRFWTRNYWETPDRRITAISALPEGPAGGSQRFSLAVTLAPAPGNTSSDLLVLNSEGRVLETVTSVSVTGLTRLTDINRDEQAELLLVRFAALELLDPGIGTRQNLPGWSYSLDAQPQAALIADVDRDGRDELVVGSSDGRLHILKAGESVAASPDITVASLGGFITQIALADLGTEGPPELVVVRNTITADEELRERFEGSLMVLRPDGRVVWEKTLPTQITSLLVDDINNSTRPELIIGTNDGQLVTFSLAGEEFWRGSVNGSVEHLVTIDGQRNGRIEIVAATSAGELYKYNNKGTIVIQLAAYLADITSLQRIDQTGELRAQLVVTVDDGTVRGLNWRGIELPSWIRQTEGLPILSLPASRSFLIATDEASLLRLDHDNTLLWSLGGHGIIKSLYWGDLDGDARADIAAGNRDGELLLFTGDGDGPWERLSVGSGVFFVSSLQGTEVDQTQLVVVSDNGEVRQFRAQVNRPPLLMNAQTQSDRGQYTVNVTVEDVEQDAVTVSLEVLDPIGETWLPQGARPVQGSGTLFWTLDPALAENGLVYRFHYSDASQQGTVGPLPGVPAVATPASPDGLALATILVVALLASAYGIVYATRAEPYRARRVYKQLRGEGEATLTYLGEAYSRHRAAPDFLLSLANLARQDNDRRLAGLCDGLFLLADRPEAALKILTTSLEEAGADGVAWRQLELWHNTMRLGHELLSAPNITELSLLRPQLVELLQLQLDADEASPSIASLLPILTALRDSERVDLADDRLVYLHEALVLIRQLQEQLLTWPMRVSSQIAAAIAYRWEGYVNAGIEELRGQARLSVVLRTRRLAPQPDGITIALEIANAGRAAAENISLRLLPDPAYEAPREPVHFAVLPPGRTRQVHLPLRPRVSDRFRLTLEVTYDDRHQTEKRLAFADLVHLLAPVRQFTPIANPYLPGTPLRRNSPLFFGRQDLFEFIARNAGRPEQRNVIILTGQRRTGKTSALLRLEHYLPTHVFPVYVDCQSLGVTPGMPALLHDIAWLIADAFAARGLEIEVPEPAEWTHAPTTRFQRQFVPQALKLLPPGTVMLLVLDEFEALESLVSDGILPSTLFTYLRHLMQHGSGLGFVFAGTRRLEEMTSDYWSILFNIALYRQIGFLDRDAALHLIAEPVAPHLVYDDLALDKILRVTAGHPYFLQLVCYTLVNRANAQRTGYVTINDVNATLEEMLRLGEAHFAYIWQRSSATERALLVAVAHMMDRELPFRPSDLQQYLADVGIHLSPAEVTAALGRLVERDIMREVNTEATTQYELRIGLVGLWTAQNKSLSKLYEELEIRTAL